MKNYNLGMDKAKNNALKILDDFGVDCVPVNPAKIARELGITVNFAAFPKHDNISGFYSAEKNAIYVNVNDAASRMTFTIAHELGHERLHKEWTQSSDYKILYRNQTIVDQKDPKEIEANAFAANLLVPKFLLEKYQIKNLLKNSIISISDVATLFAVSNFVVKFRLKNEYGI
jgi:Zn-dependent peptidase ImmA (M78 family)